MFNSAHLQSPASNYQNITGPLVPGYEPPSQTISINENLQNQGRPAAGPPAAPHRITLQRQSPDVDFGTVQQNVQATDIVSLLSKFRAGFKSGAARDYAPLPRQRQLLGMPPDAPCWRIELYGLTPDLAPIGLDILDDVVIGRGSDADFDLDPFGGYQKAVSRRHLLLRPTHRQLHLIDLGSTNGTHYNSIPIASCASHVVASDDVITLGLLTLSIRIVDGPLIARS